MNRLSRVQQRNLFEDYVVGKIDAYCDQSVTDLCNTFHIEYQKKPKSLEAMLAYRMLGIKKEITRKNLKKQMW